MIVMKCFACFEFLESLCDYVQIVVCSLVHMLANSCFPFSILSAIQPT